MTRTLRRRRRYLCVHPKEKQWLDASPPECCLLKAVPPHRRCFYRAILFCHHLYVDRYRGKKEPTRCGRRRYHTYTAPPQQQLQVSLQSFLFCFSFSPHLVATQAHAHEKRRENGQRRDRGGEGSEEGLCDQSRAYLSSNELLSPSSVSSSLSSNPSISNSCHSRSNASSAAITSFLSPNKGPVIPSSQLLTASCRRLSSSCTEEEEEEEDTQS
mmetsp:Transcript_1227/g.1871  ORF Transcript_1227/g.1871 Transcript_1227/m.1871 type:complete len:214 (+) Transcript_1227:220-861(+)